MNYLWSHYTHCTYFISALVACAGVLLCAVVYILYLYYPNSISCNDSKVNKVAKHLIIIETNLNKFFILQNAFQVLNCYVKMPSDSESDLELRPPTYCGKGKCNDVKFDTGNFKKEIWDCL